MINAQVGMISVYFQKYSQQLEKEHKSNNSKHLSQPLMELSISISTECRKHAKKHCMYV